MRTIKMDGIRAPTLMMNTYDTTLLPPITTAVISHTIGPKLKAAKVGRTNNPMAVTTPINKTVSVEESSMCSLSAHFECLFRNSSRVILRY